MFCFEKYPVRLAFLSVCFFGASHACSDTVISTFDSNLESWTGAGADNIAHELLGGNPGGYMHLTDEAGPNGPLRAFAPGNFSGDLTTYNGGLISFDGIALFTPSGSYDPIFGRIDLIGTAGTATLDIAGSPVNQWTTYSDNLTAVAWGKTESEWSAILGDITGVTLWLEFDYGDEIVGIDNFAMHSVPEPTAAFLLGALAVGLSLCRRRQAIPVSR